MERTHCLKEYAASKVLVVAFICNHCPTSQLYEARIKQIAEDYKDKGVTVVAIEPNNPDAVLLERNGLYRCGGFARRHENPRGIPALQFSLPLRRRDPESFHRIRAHAPRRIFSFLTPTASSATKAAWTTTCASHWSPNMTPATRLMRCWPASRWRSRRLPPWGAPPSGFTRKRVGAKELEEIAKKPVCLKPVSVEDLKALAQEFHRQIAARGFLGDLVWSLPRRAAPVRNHVPDVWTPRVRPGDSEHQLSRRAGRCAQGCSPRSTLPAPIGS